MREYQRTEKSITRQALKQGIKGSRTQPLSGAGAIHKLDNKVPPFLVSAKTSMKDQSTVRITKQQWEEATKHAALEGLLPALVHRMHGVDIASVSLKDLLALIAETNGPSS